MSSQSPLCQSGREWGPMVGRICERGRFWAGSERAKELWMKRVVNLWKKLNWIREKKLLVCAPVSCRYLWLRCNVRASRECWLTSGVTTTHMNGGVTAGCQRYKKPSETQREIEAHTRASRYRSVVIYAANTILCCYGSLRGNCHIHSQQTTSQFGLLHTRPTNVVKQAWKVTWKSENDVKLEGAQRVHISAKWIFLQLL